MQKSVNPPQLCSPPTIIHYNLHNKMMTKTLLWIFLIFVQSVYVFVPFPPPFPTYHIISPPSTLAKLKQHFLWTKNTKAKDIFYPHGPKQVLNIFLQRIFTRSALAEKKDYVMSSPMTIQGAWTRPMPWTT